jgi:hypothetical protein
MAVRPDPNFPAPPPGWRVLNGALIPDGSVGGYLARRQEVRASCYQRDCRRSVSIDYDWLIGHGYAAFPVREFIDLLKCRKPGGCALEARTERQGSGLPLADLARRKGVAIRLQCGACRWRKDITPAQAIAHLTAAGTGDGATLHVELTAKLTKPCAQCARTLWICEVRWPQAGDGRIPRGPRLGAAAR